jgi:hypothetical protein
MSTLLAEEVYLAHVVIHLPTSYETTSSPPGTAPEPVYFTSQYSSKTASEGSLYDKAILTPTCGVSLIDCSSLDGGVVSSSKWSKVPSLMV